MPFEDKFAALREKLTEQMAESQRLSAEVQKQLEPGAMKLDPHLL